MTKILPLVSGCTDCPYGKFVEADDVYRCCLTDTDVPYDSEEAWLNEMLKQCPLINLEDITSINNYLEVLDSVGKKNLVWKKTVDFSNWVKE